ncbi:SDR family oxidoreductase [Thermosynechococcaceae cyanobacterium BACA0444]|uniref:SDR family oxidoreductase n=1 Tax=Pseudocalidococcus azoricus BACA0444 TaxID=2918990 RepID=A0AAE4FPV0_9CYAN|nr:SDR family oxidoreductase [Pseudocalidococcus azoricus]MDS3860044.1 SDR family oxidoreductase [Pseudocalidococcus azoricus BACA0444]
MKVLVVGATGRTGSRIVQQLQERHIPVVALVRDLEKAETVLPPGIEIKVGNVLEPATLAAAIGDCDRIICATGATPSLNPLEPYLVDYEGIKNLVEVAKQQQIQHFVLVSSLCVSQFFHPLNLFWLILYWKQQAERYLQASGLTYTIVRPGGLKEENTQQPPVIAKADTLFEGSIPRAQVAEICIESLFAPSAQNKVLEVVTRPDGVVAPLSELFAQV